MRTDSGTGEVFVANYLSPNVTVVNTTTDAAVASIPFEASAWGLAYDSAQGEVFATNFSSDNVSVISDSTNAVVANVSVGTPTQGIVYRPWHPRDLRHERRRCRW